MRFPAWFRVHLAAVRALLALTVLLGAAYPLAVYAAGRLPGLNDRADGSLVSANGRTAGSALIGQSFTGKDGEPLRQYFQSRPSAGDYDPGASGASNLGPEDVVDTLPDPKLGADDPDARQSLLTQVCERSKAVGEFNGVSGARPYCTPGGVGAVLAVFGHRTPDGTVPHPTRVVSVNEEQGVVKAPFIASYKGVKVDLARFGEDYAKGLTVPVRGDAPAAPAVPPDAVTASGSGLDPHISPAYADLQVTRVAEARGVPAAQVERLVQQNTTGRALGFMGEPAVNVLKLNLALDHAYPAR
ncbi:potassium-transporting ATPase subunit C [Actinomadura geliboluensis]|uniref:Potassium-transporting ATPase KdpC subunit n=1 Tax=Actinomadura geliboluensis TaxID=882440 RepID=A0A5S4H730_9ACTN|nr:potassium-transporting ATPase subunit C [Actinomadura geliboluensis]TMR40564.1 potassium-transporting ATPase subunit C [Actinomadura geliboluensis]